MSAGPGTLLTNKNKGSFGELIPLLLAGLVVAYFPHFFWMPVWVSFIFLFLLGIRALLAWKKWPLPWKWLRTILVLSIAVIIVFSFGLRIDRDAGTALLALMLCFKTYEIQNFRDVMVTLFLAYFLVLTTVLFSETLLIALSIVVGVIMLTWVLICLNSSAGQAEGQGSKIKVMGFLRLGVIIFLQALPLALICFLLFPRLPGAFFGLSTDNKSAVTGLSENMSPGSFSQLSLSREVAFRANFEQDPDPDLELYWRAMVLWKYQGKTWHQGDLAQDKSSIVLPLPRGKTFKYSITMEPHDKHYLPALDKPVSVPEDVFYLTGNILYTEKAIKKRQRHELVSAADIKHKSLSSSDRKRALSLPEGVNPRTRALARSMLEDAGSPREMINNVLNYFNKNEFYYTLSPPLLGKDAMDEFLFQSRKGYCEHYASAFVWLMRAAGVPARVVIGYQGGEYNPLGDYYIIRQSNAHAWAEVWLENSAGDSGLKLQGWQRVDPTSAVDPERVEQGVQALNPGTDRPGFWVGQDSNWLVSAWTETRLAWDALNNGWNQWVLNYTHAQQKKLFSSLGLGQDWARALSRALFTGLGLIMLFLIVLLFWLLRRIRPYRDLTAKHYGLFCRRLANIGLDKQSFEGPVDFAARVVAKRPDLQKQVLQITDLYVGLRYSSEVQEGTNKLRALVKSFHPGTGGRGKK